MNRPFSYALFVSVLQRVLIAHGVDPDLPSSYDLAAEDREFNSPVNLERRGTVGARYYVPPADLSHAHPDDEYTFNPDVPGSDTIWSKGLHDAVFAYTDRKGMDIEGMDIADDFIKQLAAELKWPISDFD